MRPPCAPTLTLSCTWQCLSHTGTSRPLVALVGSLVPDEIVHDLEDAGIRVIRVPDVRASAPIPLIDRPDFNSTFNKIHVWGLDKDYDRLVYLDAGRSRRPHARSTHAAASNSCVRALADVLVLQNLDELFALELDEHMPFAAAPEIMPPDKFNTGVMVVKPSAMIYQKLLSAAAANEQPHDYDQVLFPASSSIGTFRKPASFAGSTRIPQSSAPAAYLRPCIFADGVPTPDHAQPLVSFSFTSNKQGLLNRVFPNWFEQSAAHRLPFHFNVLQVCSGFWVKVVLAQAG